MIGDILLFIIDNNNSMTSILVPEYPLASELARTNIIIKTWPFSIFSPTPQAWLRMRLDCKSPNLSASIVTEDKDPKPVLMP